MESTAAARTVKVATLAGKGAVEEEPAEEATGWATPDWVAPVAHGRSHTLCTYSGHSVHP